MNRYVVTHLPPRDGHPGADITWSGECRKAFDRGVSLAQAWLNNARSTWLWAVMIAERDQQPTDLERRAFEVGFLGRIHQRLCVPTERTLERQVAS